MHMFTTTVVVASNNDRTSRTHTYAHIRVSHKAHVNNDRTPHVLTLHGTDGGTHTRWRKHSQTRTYTPTNALAQTRTHAHTHAHKSINDTHNTCLSRIDLAAIESRDKIIALWKVTRQNPPQDSGCASAEVLLSLFPSLSLLSLPVGVFVCLCACVCPCVAGFVDRRVRDGEDLCFAANLKESSTRP